MPIQQASASACSWASVACSVGDGAVVVRLGIIPLLSGQNPLVCQALRSCKLGSHIDRCRVGFGDVGFHGRYVGAIGVDLRLQIAHVRYRVLVGSSALALEQTQKEQDQSERAHRPFFTFELKSTLIDATMLPDTTEPTGTVLIGFIVPVVCTTWAMSPCQPSR